MAGVLSFTLGLETSNFLRGIGLASGQIISLAGAMQGLSRVADGVWGAIERGGQLSDLSNRTGETVQTVYQLQESFKVCGVAAETVAPTLLRLQKSLSGVDEAGNKTDKVFEAMGLSMGQLRTLDTPQRIEAIGAALNKLPDETATDLATRLFGRDTAGNILQISRDYEGFQAALKQTAPAAYVFDRLAADFDKIGDTISIIKSKFGGMWAGLAAGITPDLQKILDKIAKIDFVEIGKNVGKFIGFILDSFQNGTFANVLSLSIQVGFEKGMHHAMRFAVSLGAAIMEILPAAIEASLRIGMLALAGIGGGAKFAELEARRRFIQSDVEQMEKTKANRPGGVSADFEASLQSKRAALGDIQKEQEQVGKTLEFARRDAIENAIKIMADRVPGAIKAANDAYKDSPSQPVSPAELELSRLLANFSARYDAQFRSSPRKNRGDGTDEPSNLRFGRPEVTAWEKMGLVIRGGGIGGGLDYNRNTAENTRAMVGLMRKTNELLARTPTADGFTNI